MPLLFVLDCGKVWGDIRNVCLRMKEDVDLNTSMSLNLNYVQISISH